MIRCRSDGLCNSRDHRSILLASFALANETRVEARTKRAVVGVQCVFFFSLFIGPTYYLIDPGFNGHSSLPLQPRAKRIVETISPTAHHNYLCSESQLLFSPFSFCARSFPSVCGRFVVIIVYIIGKYDLVKAVTQKRIRISKDNALFRSC